MTVSNSNPNLPNNADEEGPVRCPQGTVVLSGGACLKSHQPGRRVSIPHTRRIPPGLPSPTTSAAGTTFNVYTVCATEPAGYEQEPGSPASHPAGDQYGATINCPRVM